MTQVCSRPVQSCAERGRQTPELQFVLMQSPPTLQDFPTLQSAQAPPQSTSVSEPFATPSLQVGAWHRPLRHTPLWQSPLPKQLALLAHLPHVPPQSTSVSVPFFTPSLHVPALHELATQTLLMQSLPATHALPVAQRAHDPPQSTSVSLPFFAVSLHVAEEQVPPELQ
jgi:hypothetical protein